MEIDNQLKKLEKRYNTLWNRSWKRNNVPKEEKEALNKEMNVLFSEIEELKKQLGFLIKFVSLFTKPFQICLNSEKVRNSSHM